MTRGVFYNDLTVYDDVVYFSNTGFQVGANGFEFSATDGDVTTYFPSGLYSYNIASEAIEQVYDGIASGEKQDDTNGADSCNMNGVTNDGAGNIYATCMTSATKGVVKYNIAGDTATTISTVSTGDGFGEDGVGNFGADGIVWVGGLLLVYGGPSAASLAAPKNDAGVAANQEGWVAAIVPDNMAPSFESSIIARPAGANGAYGAMGYDATNDKILVGQVFGAGFTLHDWTGVGVTPKQYTATYADPPAEEEEEDDDEPGSEESSAAILSVGAALLSLLF